jgi:hypothetical protein
MDWNEFLHDPHHLAVSSGESKMISEPTVRSAQTVHLSWIKISTISKQTKQASIWALSPRSTIHCVQNDFWHYGTFGANCAPIMHRNQHYLQKDQNEILHDPRHQGVPSGVYKTVSEAMVRLVQTVVLFCTDANTICKRTETRFYMTHIT